MLLKKKVLKNITRIKTKPLKGYGTYQFIQFYNNGTPKGVQGLGVRMVVYKYVIPKGIAGWSRFALTNNHPALDSAQPRRDHTAEEGKA